MALVSVVVPTYNRPEHLSGAISTVLDQTLDDTEVVVVDDGSDTAYVSETVSTFPDSVRYVRHDSNRGLSAARNTGIREATGRYVAFLDDDDRWHPSKLERQVATLEGDSSVGLVSCLLKAVSPDGDVLRCEGSKPDGDLSDEILVRNVIGSPSRVLVRSECVDETETFDEQLPTKQDWDFYIRLCQRWRVAVVDQHLCYRTVHASMSSDPNAAREHNRRVIKKHEDKIEARDLHQRTMTAYYANVGRTHLENSDPVQAREYLRRSLRNEFRFWHLGLYLLTFTGMSVCNVTIDAKRRVEKVLYCD